MPNLKTAIVVALGVAAIITPAMAAPVCANATDMAAFRTAAVQQQLMVAALTCRDVEAYNRFVLAYQPELQQSDADLKDYFIRRGNEAEYDTFKTKLANLSSLSDIANGPAYCANAAAAFDIALKSRQSLSSFVADQRLMIAMPKQTMCVETAPVIEAAAAKMPVRIAEANVPKPEPVKLALAAAAPQSVPQTRGVPGVPAHALPASPYGDSYNNEDRAAPAPTYQRDEDNSDSDEAPPPRPERPRTLQASREEDYYAAQYANIWRSRRWAPPPDADSDYWGR